MTQYAVLQAQSATDPAERLAQLLDEDLQATSQIIYDRLSSDRSQLIEELASHLIEAGGKLLRPLVTLAVARMCGYRGDRHTYLAASVECIHSATLLHDDVVDESNRRRGKDSANSLWGNKASVLVGDFLFSRSFQLMVECGSLEILRLLADASAVIAEGEVMQLSTACDLSTSEESYLQMIGAKTAELFAAAAESGGVLAGVDADARAALRAYGRSIGIGFQLADDALDYCGDEQIMGKDVGDDFHDRKATMPVLYAYAGADNKERAFWQRVIEMGDVGEGDLLRAKQYVRERGGVHKTIELATSYCERAREALSVFPESVLRTTLEELAMSVARRGR